MQNWHNLRKQSIRNGGWCTIPNSECTSKELLDDSLIYIVGKENVEKISLMIINEVINTINEGSFVKDFDKKIPLKPQEIVELIKNKFYLIKDL